MRTNLPDTVQRIGFVATRIAGTDGVSLETKKWADVFEKIGLECYYITGESDRPSEQSMVVDEAHFQHPQIADISERAFGSEQRTGELTDEINRLARHLRERLTEAVERFAIDVMVAENSITIPMNIPLGLAIVHTVQEMNLPCIAHHHDFHWERERFLVNSVDDFIRAAFPPAIKQIDHVAINSQAAEEFCRRTGISCRVIPNVMDFANPPDPVDDYALRFRQAIGLGENDLLILQPTRVVARKAIEHSVELIRWLDDPRAKLVITHSTGDEGDSYARRVRRFAELLDVEVIFAEKWIAPERGETADGQPVFAISDVYPQADLITYPSTYEGFGNAFLEAIYFKRPVVCNSYAVFLTDIAPSGFRTIQLDGYLTDNALAEVRRVLSDDAYVEEMVEHNYEVGRQFFSYDVVEETLRAILRRPQTACRTVSSRSNGRNSNDDEIQ